MTEKEQLAGHQKRKMNNENTNKDQLKAIIKKISDAGVSFIVGDIPDGSIELGLDEVIRYVENRDEYFADRYNVSTEIVKEYNIYLENCGVGQCTAITKKKQQCRRYARGTKTIKEFENNKAILCELHS